MKRLVVALAVLLATCALVPAASSAAGPVAATGGGRGTVDGVQAFSDFGFSVTRSSEGAVEGHFNCLMAGSSQFPGFTLMAVRGQVTQATMGASSASFDGVGMFLAPGVFDKSAATFHVEVTAGGPGVGTLHLTLLTPMFFDLPVEHVLHGQISIH
jgi:opacity protein-like surface antigen